MKRSKRFSKNTRSRRKTYKNKSKSKIRKLKSKKVKRGGSENKLTGVFGSKIEIQSLAFSKSFQQRKSWDKTTITDMVSVNRSWNILQLKCDDFTYKFILNIILVKKGNTDTHTIISEYYKSLSEALNKQTSAYTKEEKIMFFKKFIEMIGQVPINIGVCPNKSFNPMILFSEGNDHHIFTVDSFRYCGPKFSKQIKQIKENLKSEAITPTEINEFKYLSCKNLREKLLDHVVNTYKHVNEYKLKNYLIEKNKSNKYNLVELLGFQDFDTGTTCEKCREIFKQFEELMRNDTS